MNSSNEYTKCIIKVMQLIICAGNCSKKLKKQLNLKLQ